MRNTKKAISRAPSPSPSPSANSRCLKQGEGNNTAPPLRGGSPQATRRGEDEGEGDKCGFTNDRISNFKYIIAFLIFFAVFSRLWGIGSEAFFFDEYMHVPSAYNYTEQGQFAPDFWYHPPLKHILLYSSMKLFGNNPYGWRLRNIIFGVFSVLLLYLLCRSLFTEKRTAYLAASFMAIEPMHIFTSRIASEEIPGMFFCMMGVYAAIHYLKGWRHGIVASGIFFGLALATKWYFQLSLLFLFAFVLVITIKKEGFRGPNIFYIVTSLTVLPAGVYLATFFPWFCRGYSLTEFIQMQMGALKTVQTVTMTGFFADSMFPLEWFIKPVVLIRKLSPGWTDYQVFMSNFPVWLLTIPAILFIINRLRVAFDRNLFLVLLLWVSMYLPLLIVNRPILLYSALPLMPFVYLMTAYMINVVLEKTKSADLYFNYSMVAVTVWGLYLWPLAVRLPVPSVLYDPLRLIGKIATE